jgi:hypothetical protein
MLATAARTINVCLFMFIELVFLLPGRRPFIGACLALSRSKTKAGGG